MRNETDRRTFLRLCLAVLGGGIVGSLLPAIDEEVNELTEKTTNFPTGNAGVKQYIEESCGSSNNPQACVQNFKFSARDEFEATITAPVMEEFLLRLIPSAGLSLVQTAENPAEDIICGTGELGLSKGELAAGIVTSLLFGASHNMTKKGFSTEAIPASQTFNGFIYWYLQRKLGFFSNTLAHARSNFKKLH